MHMFTLIIKLMDVLIIYLISTCEHKALFLKHIYPYLIGLDNSSFHNLIIHYTNHYCWYKVK